MKDIISTEILAIVRACKLIESKAELTGRTLVVVSDSRVAVRWISGCGLGNSSHEKLISDIQRWLARFDQATVEFCPRGSNSYADILAKKGAILVGRSWSGVMFEKVGCLLFF
ncbi:hypothetical protein Q3G72_011565 [Acer saccharum]|nr:hypothetical protein Q3G72_011565 [Acer saccharum]